MPRTGRPRAFDRAEALRKAKELFWSRGYGETSVDDLTTALGIQRGSLYGAFGDKRDLYTEVVELYWHDNREQLQTALASGPVLPVLRRMLMLMQPATITGASVRRGCLIGNTTASLAATDPRLKTLVSKAFDEFVQIVGAALARGQATGEIASDASPETQARLVLVLFQGSSLLSRAQDEGGELDAAIDVALTSLRGIDNP